MTRMEDPVNEPLMGGTDMTRSRDTVFRKPGTTSNNPRPRGASATTPGSGLRLLAWCRPVILLLAAAVLPAPAQPAAAREEAGGPTAPEEIPEAVAELGILNARVPAARLLTAGQITPEQMTVLHEIGYDTFISLRTADEQGAGWEEEAAGATGVHFIRIPIAGAAGISRENAEKLAQQMPATPTGRTVIYCASGNRVGALLALKAHFVDGLPAPEALSFGLAAGLTRLEPVVREQLGLPEKKP